MDHTDIFFFKLIIICLVIISVLGVKFSNECIIKWLTVFMCLPHKSFRGSRKELIKAAWEDRKPNFDEKEDK